MQQVIQFFKNKKIYLFVILTVTIIGGSGAAFLPGILTAPQTSESASTKVLGAQSVHNPTVTLTPSATPTPSLVPTIKPRAIVPTNSPTPTAVPVNNSQNASPTATPTPGQSAPSSPTATPTPSPTPTPTPVADQVTIKAGSDTWTGALNAGETAFEVIKRVVGDGLTYDSYDCCGAFITGFHGEQAVYPQWWEFLVNGASSSVGVSAYHPANGDVLEFVYHE